MQRKGSKPWCLDLTVSALKSSASAAIIKKSYQKQLSKIAIISLAVVRSIFAKALVDLNAFFGIYRQPLLDKLQPVLIVEIFFLAEGLHNAVSWPALLA